MARAVARCAAGATVPPAPRTALRLMSRCARGVLSADSLSPERHADARLLRELGRGVDPVRPGCLRLSLIRAGTHALLADGKRGPR